MYGRHINALNVFTQNTTGFENLVWSKQGQQGNKWIKATVNLDSYVSYSIILEGVRGQDYEGDISLDDISLVEGTCPTNDVLKCDFELDTCNLMNDITAKFNWTRAFGKTAYSTGPSYDHTVILNKTN